MWFFFRLLGALALMSLHAQALPDVPAPVVIELHAKALIDHPRVTLADVAAIKGREQASQALAAVELGAAPRIGYTERLTRTQIERVLRRHGAGNTAFTFVGADAVAIQTAAQTVSAATLREAAQEATRSAFAQPGRQLDSAPASSVSAVEVPEGRLVIRARALPPGIPAARTIVWLDLHVDGALYRSVVVPLQLTVRQNAYVARRALEQGAWSGPDDFITTQADVAGVDAVPVAHSLAPFRLAQALIAGQVLTAPAQAAGGKIMRGDQVRVLVKAGQIGIETTAIALSDAGPGQLLQVRPAGGNNIIAGRLDQSGTVTIE